MFSRMERPGKDHQVFKVFKPLRVQGYIEVRIGSGKDVVKHTTISNTKGSLTLGTRRSVVWLRGDMLD